MMKHLFFRRKGISTGPFLDCGPSSKWGSEDKRRESPYYYGHGTKQSKASSKNSEKSTVQGDSSMQTDNLSPNSSQNLEPQLSNSFLTTTGHGYSEENQSVLHSKVSHVTGIEVQGSSSNFQHTVKSSVKESDCFKSSVSSTVQELCESQSSLTDPNSSDLLPIIIDASSSMDENHVTENKYLINKHEGYKKNDYVIMTKGHSTHVQATNKTGIHYVLFAHSAAYFYKPESLQSEDNIMCDSIRQLNKYLQDSKTEVEAGAPGKFLHIVIGKELPDLGSIVSVITYAYCLKTTSRCDQLCSVPVINMKRADLPLFPEVEWLFESCCIEQTLLMFIDEIDLSYYYQFGSVKVVLVNNHRLPSSQEIYKDAVVEVLDCNQGDSIYPWVNSVNIEQVGSCCTLVAENIALSSPTYLAGHGLSRLLLAAILLDTANLTSRQCTTKDKCMATLLIKGARQIGRLGFFLLLKHKKFDISNMKIADILRKNFKDWTKQFGKHDGWSFKGEMVCVGMSSIGVSISEFLNREVSIVEEIFNFMETRMLSLLVIVTGYYDNMRKFKRELIFVGENVNAVKSIVHFFNKSALRLEPKQIYASGFQDSIKAFNITDTIISRNKIELMLEEFLVV